MQPHVNFDKRVARNRIAHKFDRRIRRMRDEQKKHEEANKESVSKPERARIESGV